MLAKESITGLLVFANPNDKVKYDTRLSFFYVWVNTITVEVTRICQRHGIESRGQVTDEEFREAFSKVASSSSSGITI